MSKPAITDLDNIEPEHAARIDLIEEKGAPASYRAWHTNTGRFVVTEKPSGFVVRCMSPYGFIGTVASLDAARELIASRNRQ